MRQSKLTKPARQYGGMRTQVLPLREGLVSV